MKRQLFYRIHSFIGVVTGLMLFVICWGGTTAVLGHEIDWLVTPALRIEPPSAMETHWSDWRRSVERRYPEAELLRLHAPRNERSAAIAVVLLENDELVNVFVDPATAEVRGTANFYTVQRFLRNLHMGFFMDGSGIYVVSPFGILLLLSAGTALVFYRRWWRRFLLVPRGQGRRFWSGLHRTAGLWSLAFVLITGTTGLWYGMELLRMDVLDGKFSYAGSDESAIVRIPEPVGSGTPLTLDALLERARAERPQLDIRQVGFDTYYDGALYLEGQAGHLLVRDRANQLHLDSYNGDVLHSQSAAGLPLYWRWSETADPLHFGDFAGLVSKIAWCLFGLTLCGLILTGTGLHIARLSRHSPGRHEWRINGAVLAGTLLFLGYVIYRGFDQAIVYGHLEDGVRQFPDLSPGVQSFIAVWSALTLAIVVVWSWWLIRPATTPGASGRERRNAYIME